MRRFALGSVVAVTAVIGAAGAGCGREPKPVFTIDDPWPQDSLLPAATGPRAFFTNNNSDTISVVDLDTMTSIATLPAQITPLEHNGPHHLVASPDGRFLFVGMANPGTANATGPHGSHGQGTADGYLLKIDAITGRIVGHARVQQNPGDVRWDPSGTRVWQSHYNYSAVIQAVTKGLPPDSMDSYLIATNPDTMERAGEIRVCPGGHGIDFSPDHSRIYVVCNLSDQLAVGDMSKLTAERVPIGPLADAPPSARYLPYAVTVSPADGRAWVSAQGPGLLGLYVYDPSKNNMVPDATVVLNGAPVFGTFTRDGSRLFMVTQRPDALIEIDPVRSAIMNEIDISAMGCLNAHKVALSPDESALWIVCEGDQYKIPGTFEVLDAHSFKHTAHVTLGLYSDDIALVMPPPSGTAR